MKRASKPREDREFHALDFSRYEKLGQVFGAAAVMCPAMVSTHSFLVLAVSV
jgi:hypothetical protein